MSWWQTEAWKWGETPSKGAVIQPAHGPVETLTRPLRFIYPIRKRGLGQRSPLESGRREDSDLPTAMYENRESETMTAESDPPLKVTLKSDLQFETSTMPLKRGKNTSWIHFIILFSTFFQVATEKTNTCYKYQTVNICTAHNLLSFIEGHFTGSVVAKV